MKKNLSWKNVKIGTKYALAMITAISFFLCSTVIIFILINASKSDLGIIETAGDNTLEITELISAFEAQDVRTTDFILFQTPSLIEEFQENTKNIEVSLDDFKTRLKIEGAEKTIEYLKQNTKEMDAVFVNEIVPAVERQDKPRYMIARKKLTTYLLASKEPLRELQQQLKESRQVAMQNSRRQLDSTVVILVVSITVSTIVGLLVMFVISRMIYRQLNRVISLSREVSEGNLAVDKMDYNGSDEIGQLAQSFNAMTDSLRHIIGQIMEASKSVNHQSSELSESAEQVKQGIEQVAVTMEQLSTGVEEQANSSTEVVNVIEGLNNQIIKANEQSGFLEKAAVELQGMADKGYTLMENSIQQMETVHDVVKSSSEKMKELDEKAQKISQLVEIIQNISEQTNLLALNAAIEAARAGEAGRGFAVVAEEIRKLAEQVGDSVKGITDIVRGIQDEARTVASVLQSGYGQVEEGTRQIKVTGETFRNINAEVISVVERVNSVGSSMEEIAKNSEKINYSVEQIASISEETAAGVEETSASVQQQHSSMEVIQNNAQDLSKLAQDLNGMVARFKL